MKNVLITGFNGFIGSHLVNSLEPKCKIVGVSSTKSNEKNIKKIEKDIRKIHLSDLPKDIDCIIHLAAMSDVRYCDTHPTECIDVNLLGTQKMLDISRKLDSQFIFLSTSHVYGRPKKLPIDENHEKNPQSVYSVTKNGAESICETYSKAYGIDVSIARLFSVYGPKSPEHLVTTRIISQILTKKNLKLGNLSPKRDFIYIDDVINAITLLIQKNKGFNIFNVGSGKSYSILQICKILKKISRINFEIKTTKSISRSNDIPKIVSNSSKLMKLGWKPKIDIKKGLELTYDWYQNK